MKDNYHYNDALVNFYDKIDEDYIEDIEFYISRIMNSNGPVLEVGCGTGRIFVPALEKGADIYGIDLNEKMLNKLKEKIDVCEYHRVQMADALDYISDRKYKLIISPFRVFQHILTVKEQLQFLKNVYNSLDENSEFIFNVFNPAFNRISKGDSENLCFDGEYCPGKRLKYYESAKPDIPNQVQHVTFRFEWEDENGNWMEDKFYYPMRYFFRFELQHLVERAGFELVHIYRDFECNELDNTTKEFVVICRK